MAKKLKAFPNTSRHSTRSLYPWQQWLDGSVWELTRGTDFKCKAVSFRATAITQAYRRGGSLRTSIAKDGLSMAIQFRQGRRANESTELEQRTK